MPSILHLRESGQAGGPRMEQRESSSSAAYGLKQELEHAWRWKAGPSEEAEGLSLQGVGLRAAYECS